MSEFQRVSPLRTLKEPPTRRCMSNQTETAPILRTSAGLQQRHQWIGYLCDKFTTERSRQHKVWFMGAVVHQHRPGVAAAPRDPAPCRSEIKHPSQYAASSSRTEPITRVGPPFPVPTPRHCRLSPVELAPSLQRRSALPPARPVQQPPPC